MTQGPEQTPRDIREILPGQEGWNELTPGGKIIVIDRNLYARDWREMNNNEMSQWHDAYEQAISEYFNLGDNPRIDSIIKAIREFEGDEKIRETLEYNLLRFLQSHTYHHDKDSSQGFLTEASERRIREYFQQRESENKLTDLTQAAWDTVRYNSVSYEFGLDGPSLAFLTRLRQNTSATPEDVQFLTLRIAEIQRYTGSGKKPEGLPDDTPLRKVIRILRRRQRELRDDLQKKAKKAQQDQQAQSPDANRPASKPPENPKPTYSEQTQAIAKLEEISKEQRRIFLKIETKEAKWNDIYTTTPDGTEITYRQRYEQIPLEKAELEDIIPRTVELTQISENILNIDFHNTEAVRIAEDELKIYEWLVLKAEITGKRPIILNREDRFEYPFWRFREDIKSIRRQFDYNSNGKTRETNGQAKITAELSRQSALLDLLPEGFAEGFSGNMMRGQDLASYMFEPQRREHVEFINQLGDRAEDNLSFEQRKETIARLVGTMMQAGRVAGMAQFLLSSLETNTEASSIESTFGGAMELASKLAQAVGYNDGETIHKIMGFMNPEKMGALTEQGITTTFWIRQEDGTLIEREVEMKPKDVWATIYDNPECPEALGEILVDLAAPTYKNPYQAASEGEPFEINRERDGYWTNRAKWFSYALLRKLGYPPAEAKAMAHEAGWEGNIKGGHEYIDEQGHRQVTKALNIEMTDQVSFVEGRDVNTFGKWIGQNWWMYMHAQNKIYFDRSDIIVAIDEAKRRDFIGLRKVELADYGRKYDNIPTPAQYFNAWYYHPEFQGYALKSALMPVLYDNCFPDAGDVQTRDLRKEILDKLAILETTPPELGKEIAMMANGLGRYDKADNFDAWKEESTGMLRNMSRSGQVTNRKFSQWQHVEFDQQQLEQAWGNDTTGFNFESLLRTCGWVDEDFQRLNGQSTRGVTGFNIFRRAANGRLYDFMRASWRDYDGTERYIIHVSNFFSQGVQYFEGSTLEGATKIAQPMILPDDTELASIAEQVRPYVEIKPTALGQKSAVIKTYIEYSEGLAELSKLLKSPGYGESESQQKAIYTVISLAAELNISHNLDKRDVYVENLEQEQVGAGYKFSQKRLTREKFEEIWRAKGIDPKQVEHTLNGYGCYFTKAGDSPKEFLIGPHGGPLPELIKPLDLINQLETRAIARIKEIAHQEGRFIPDNTEVHDLLTFVSKIEGMKSTRWFSWATLIDGAWGLSPYEVALMLYNQDKGDRMAEGPKQRLLTTLQRRVEQGQISPSTIGPDGWRLKRVLITYLNKLLDPGLIGRNDRLLIWKQNKPGPDISQEQQSVREGLRNFFGL